MFEENKRKLTKVWQETKEIFDICKKEYSKIQNINENGKLTTKHKKEQIPSTRFFVVYQNK